MEPLPNKRRHYQVFTFDGSFMHESISMSATPQLHEVLSHETPERVQLTVRAEDSQEVFEIIAEMKVVRIQDHYYERDDAQSTKRNRKDARKNKKFLGHLPQYSDLNKQQEKETAPNKKLKPLTTPVHEWG